MRSKRLLAMLLTLTMIVSGVPSAAIAAETEAPVQVEEQQYNDVEAQDSVEDGEAAEITEVPAESQEEAAAPAEAVSEEETPAAAEAPETEEAPAQTEEAPAQAEEAPAQAEEAPAQAEEAEVMTFEGRANGVNVYVEAPAGAFEAGTVMTVKKASAQDVIDAINDTEDVNIEVKSVKAVDITFTDANGEAQPKLPINVKLTSDLVAETEAPIVVHVDDEGVAEEMTEVQAVEGEDDAIEFEAEHFSVYAIIETGATATGEPRATYHFQNSDGTPYYFMNTAGKQVDVQILKNGETLENVGIPDIDVTNESFNGWYYWRNGSFGSKVEFGPVSVTGNDDIYIRANIGEVAYLTFYEDAEGTIVLDRVQEAVGVQYDISQKTVDAPEAELAFTGWSESSGYNNDGRTAIENTTITVNGNKSYYPVFKSAHWVRFTSAPVGSGATYIAPAFVLAGATAASAQPSENPIWKGHRFLGWSETEDTNYEAENAFSAYNFNQQLNSDVVLYAHWTAAEATYTVQFWKQNISDDKNAANKTYSFAAQETRKATAGTTVSPTNEDKGKVASEPENYKGFVYNNDKTDSSITVNADGTSVLNVYYDRQLITFKFYKNGTSTNAPGYNSQYYNTTTGNTRVTVYTGLYGQDFSKYNYTWPDGMYTYYYNNGNDTRGISFLGEFVPPSMIAAGVTEVRMFYSGEKVATVEFYLQNVDGTYPDTASNVGVSSGGDFRLADKYEAFKVVSYRRYTGDHNWVENSWIEGTVGTEVSMSYNSGWNTYYYNLAVRYERKTHTLKYLDSADGTELNGISSVLVPYEGNLNDKKPSSSFVPVSQTEGKVWDGKWYMDQACTTEFNWNATMPNADVNVYAGWEDVWFWVKIEPAGGELHETEATYFWELYGGKIEEYADISRGYIEDASGSYYYHYDEFNESDPEGTQPSTRLAYYTTDSAAASSSTKYAKQDKAYDLIGWYDISDGEENAKPYNFETPLTKNTILQARWRRVGEYKVVYDTKGYLKGEDGALVEDSTVEGSIPPVDNATYADKSDSSILSPITPPTGYVFVGWYFDSAEMYPGDIFKVDAAKADENKNIHIKPVFQKYESQPVGVTHINWYANKYDVIGSDITGVATAETYSVTYDDVSYNAAYPIEKIEDVIPEGVTYYDDYTFLGWAKKDVTDASEPIFTEDDLFLKYENGSFQAKDKDGNWVSVASIGADENQPYQDLYAVWQGSFKVYHSGAADGNIETIAMNNKTLTNGKYDITKNLTSGTIYGGYYSNYKNIGSIYTGGPDVWNSEEAYTSAVTVTGGGTGTAMTPVVGQTYYLKEVPDAYMQASNYEIYHKTTGVEKAFYFVTAVDDNNYQEVGFKIGAKNTDYKSTLTEKIRLTYTDPDPEIYDSWDSGELDVSSFNDVEAGYVAYVQNDKIITTAGASVTYRPYFKTFDGVFVYGRQQRTAKSNRKVKPVTYESVTITKKMFW